MIGENHLATEDLVLVQARETKAPFTRYNRLSNRLYNPVWQPVVKPVVKPVLQPVWQPVGCLFTRYRRLSNQLYDRFDNRFYRVNGV